MRNKWLTTLPKEGLKAYIYTSDTKAAAKVYDAASDGTLHDSVPQFTTDSSGKLEFWVDTSDYDLDQLFDIDVYTELNEHYTSYKNQSIFDIKDYLGVMGGALYSYTWDKDVNIASGQCLSLVLPPGKEIYMPDGVSLDIADGGDLIIFSL